MRSLPVAFLMLVGFMAPARAQDEPRPPTVTLRNTSTDTLRVEFHLAPEGRCGATGVHIVAHRIPPGRGLSLAAPHSVCWRRVDVVATTRSSVEWERHDPIMGRRVIELP